MQTTPLISYVTCNLTNHNCHMHTQNTLQISKGLEERVAMIFVKNDLSKITMPNIATIPKKRVTTLISDSHDYCPELK